MSARLSPEKAKKRGRGNTSVFYSKFQFHYHRLDARGKLLVKYRCRGRYDNRTIAEAVQITCQDIDTGADIEALILEFEAPRERLYDTRNYDLSRQVA
jgi:hypothetical protein